MKDINGKELKIGDRVVYIAGKTKDAELAIGEIKKFYKDRWGADECTVDSHTHVSRKRIMSLSE